MTGTEALPTLKGLNHGFDLMERIQPFQGWVLDGGVSTQGGAALALGYDI
jgi:hypothetical protein